MATTCNSCKGSGGLICPKCIGKGTIGGGLISSPSKCSHCQGSGKVKCGICNGRGKI